MESDLSPVQPIRRQSSRYLLQNYIVSSLKFVDEVVTYDTEADLIKVLKNIQPDVRILGADHEGKPFTGHELPIKCIFNTRDHGYSTSELRKRVFEVEKSKI